MFLLPQSRKEKEQQACAKRGGKFNKGMVTFWHDGRQCLLLDEDFVTYLGRKGSISWMCSFESISTSVCHRITTVKLFFFLISLDDIGTRIRLIVQNGKLFLAGDYTAVPIVRGRVFQVWYPIVVVEFGVIFPECNRDRELWQNPFISIPYLGIYPPVAWA